jgi:hypothetical protein
MVVFRMGGDKACLFVCKWLHWPGVEKVEVCTSGLYSDIRIGLWLFVKMSETPSIMLLPSRSRLCKYSANCHCGTFFKVTRNIYVQVYLIQVRCTRSPPVSIELLWVLWIIVVKKGTLIVQADDYIGNISPITLRESDYGSLEGNSLNLCKRVWPKANRLTANMDRTGSPDSDFPSISCQFCKTATLFKDSYAGSNHCLGVFVFLEEIRQRWCLVKLGEMALGSSLPPPQTLQEQDLSIWTKEALLKFIPTFYKTWLHT